jgi:WD40 repeat protein
VGLLDKNPYPFDTPDGRKLHSDLANNHNPRVADGLSREAGLPMAAIDLSGSPLEVWRSVLMVGAKSGKLRDLAQVILDDPTSVGVHALLRRLLDEPPDLVNLATGLRDGVRESSRPGLGPDPANSAAEGGEVPPVADGDWKAARTLAGHSEWVHGLAFSPDGSLLCSAGDDQLLMWDMVTGQARPLPGHTDVVSAVAFSPDGHLLASASADRTVRLWNVQDRKAETVLTGHTDVVSAVAFSPDGRLLASASADRTVRLWNVRAGTENRTLAGHSSRLSGLAFSPTGTLLASAAWVDQAIRLWDPSSGEATLIRQDHKCWLLGVAFNPSGTLLASACASDRRVLLWEVSTGTVLTGLIGHTGPVTCVCFSPDGTLLASGGGTDHEVRIWAETAS